MKIIKKTIDIILISAVIAGVIVFADKIIPVGRSGDHSLRSVGSINDNISEDTADSGGIKNEKKFDFEMIIDKDLFIQKQDFFIASPAGNNKDNDNKSLIETETISEESSFVSDIDIQENGPDSEQAEIVANGDNVETAPDENVEDNGQPAPDEENIDYSDSGNFRIKVDLSRQRVIVFYKDDMLREMICSGGAPESPTPMGEFVTLQKIPKAFVERFNVGAYYWIRFFEDYLIHSVPFDENWEMIIEEFEKLGSPVSHGCIRLKLEEAKWLYETLPLGVKVLIY